MDGDRPACRRQALDLLARREHARRELERKLGERGHDEALIAVVLDELTREGLLADERFAESFIRARVARGQGPVRIGVELDQRGVEAGQRLLRSGEHDWSRLARDARARRFGSACPTSYVEKARQARFLERRGFTSAQIRDALEFTDDPE